MGIYVVNTLNKHINSWSCAGSTKKDLI